MISIRWFICCFIVCMFLHLLTFALFGTIALWSLLWWVKTIVIGLLGAVAANWITGE